MKNIFFRKTLTLALSAALLFLCAGAVAWACITGVTSVVTTSSLLTSPTSCTSQPAGTAAAGAYSYRINWADGSNGTYGPVTFNTACDAGGHACGIHTQSVVTSQTLSNAVVTTTIFTFTTEHIALRAAVPPAPASTTAVRTPVTTTAIPN